MLVFLIGAVVLSIVVLWRKQSWYVYLLGLLGWAMVSSVITLWSVFNCAFYFNGDPCPLMHVLSYPVSIQSFVVIYRWCPNCLGYQLQIWLGGLMCWEGVSPALTGSVAQAAWLTRTIFPLLQVVSLVGALVVFAVVWGAKSAIPRFRVVRGLSVI